MGKRVRITNSRVNSYGTRVLTTGMDIEQYKRNPVLLYMHERGSVIGYVKDLQTDGDDVTGELMFDEASELSTRCKKQFEFGSLKMVSVGIDILAMSEDETTLMSGQTRPTIIKSKLFEVSLVDVGSNDDAIVMKKNGQTITLGKDGSCAIPLLNNKKQKQMDQKMIALQLGLPEKATEDEIKASLNELKTSKALVETLKKEKETLQLAAITQIVEFAITEKRISEERKEQFITLGKNVGTEELKRTFDAMTPQIKLSSLIGHQGGIGITAYTKLSDVPESEIARLRSEEPATYSKLYKAEYGIDCEL